MFEFTLTQARAKGNLTLTQVYLTQVYLSQVYLTQVYLTQVYLTQVYLTQVNPTSRTVELGWLYPTAPGQRDFSRPSL